MHEIGGSEGEDNSPRITRIPRAFLSNCNASSACAEISTGAANSQEYVYGQRSPLLIFCENFVQKQSVKSDRVRKIGFYKGCRPDSARSGSATSCFIVRDVLSCPSIRRALDDRCVLGCCVWWASITRSK